MPMILLPSVMGNWSKSLYSGRRNTSSTSSSARHLTFDERKIGNMQHPKTFIQTGQRIHPKLIKRAALPPRKASENLRLHPKWLPLTIGLCSKTDSDNRKGTA